MLKHKVLLSLVLLGLFGALGVSAAYVGNPGDSNYQYDSEVVNGNVGIFTHGDHGGASYSGVHTYIGYDKVHNIYYAWRVQGRSSHLSSAVSGTYFETKGMRESEAKLNAENNARNTAVANENKAMTDGDRAIIDNMHSLGSVRYDSADHDKVTLAGGSDGNSTVITNVKSDSSDASSLINGNDVFVLNKDIVSEVSNREKAVADESSARTDADKAFSDRIGSIVYGSDVHYVNGDNSVSDNLVSLDNTFKENSDAADASYKKYREDIASEISNREAGDKAISDKLGVVSSNGNYLNKDVSAVDNLSRLDSALTDVSEHTNDFDKYVDKAVSSEREERIAGDQALSDRIGTFASDSDVHYLDKNSNVTDNLKSLDNAARVNNDVLAREIAERDSSISELGNKADSMLDDSSKRISKAGANVAAITSLHYGDYVKGMKTSLSAGFGNYRNSTSGALGARYYFNRDLAMNAAFTFGEAHGLSNFGLSARIRQDTPEQQIFKDTYSQLESIYADNEKLLKEIHMLKVRKGGNR